MSIPQAFRPDGAGARRFLFTLTTGRSGTQYLAQLLQDNLPDAEVHHEQRRRADWGVNCPDVSHMTAFNLQGNTGHVRAFWQQRFARIQAGPTRWFAETSHTLAKAGLVENLGLLRGAGAVHLFCLTRDIAQTAISLTHRADFCALSNMWLWYLAPDYPNRMMDPAPLLPFGQIGLAVWYVIEMRARTEYYRQLLARAPEVMLHDWDLADMTTPEGAARLLAELGVARSPQEVVLPGKVNANEGGFTLDAAERQYVQALVAHCRFDAAEVARRWHAEGRRLGPAA